MRVFGYRERHRESPGLSLAGGGPPGNLNPGSLPLWTASPRVPSSGMMREFRGAVLLAQTWGTGQALPEPMPGRGGRAWSSPGDGKASCLPQDRMLLSISNTGAARTQASRRDA